MGRARASVAERGLNLREHVLLGGVAAAAVTPFIGRTEGVVFFASSILIDADHYLEFLWRNHFADWSPRRMFAYFAVLLHRMREPDLLALSIFHTAEFLMIVYLLGRWLDSPLIRAALWGLGFHIVLDIGYLTWHGSSFCRAHSLGEYLIRRRALVRRGVNPDRIFQEALDEVRTEEFASPRSVSPPLRLPPE